MIDIDNDLKTRFLSVREQSLKLCAPLKPEDYVVQPVVDVSPPKWHLAHTTWFFENFVLVPNVKDYKPFHPKFNLIFNSYYVAAGERWQRANRGQLTRPTVKEIFRFREYVEEHMVSFLENTEPDTEILKIKVEATPGLNRKKCVAYKKRVHYSPIFCS